MTAAGTATPTQFDLTTAEPERYARNRPSFYADPVAWLMLAALETLVPGGPADPEGTAVLTVSRTSTLDTMHSVALGTRRGRVSPLQFAGANPGSLSSLACLTWHLRGPSLTFVGDPGQMREAGTAVVESWLHDGQATGVLVGVHALSGGCAGRPAQHRVRASLVSLTAPLPLDSAFDLAGADS